MEEYTLICLVPGAKDTFSVRVKKDQLVGELRQEIKHKNAHKFKDVDAKNLTLHQIKINLDVSDENEYDNTILEVSQPGYVFIPKRKLIPTSEISLYFGEPSDRPRRAIHILVEPPQTGDPSPSSGTLPDILQPLATFKVLSPGSWHNADLAENDILMFTESQPEPEYVKEFKEKLSQKRLVTKVEPTALKRLRFWLESEFDKYFEATTHTEIDASAAPWEVTYEEAFHYDYIFCQRMLQNPKRFTSSKTSTVHTLLHELHDYVAQIDKDQSACLKFNCSWDFPLIVDTSVKKVQYTLKSDASLRVNKFPHLVLELISDQSQSDKIRMLLQAACLARVGEALSKDPERPAIVSAIYIDGSLCAKWHFVFVYQPDGLNAVRYMVQDFDLTDAKTTFDFVFRLHNLASLANGNDTLQQPFAKLSKLALDIKALKFKTLSSISGLKRKAGNEDDAGDGPPKKRGTEGGQVEGDTLFDVVILEELKRAGYTIQPEVENFESLLPLTAKLQHAVSAHGEHVILKLTDEHEVEVLRRLHGNQSTEQTRIIPLLDVVGGRVMVLPLRTPLSHFLALDALDGDVEQLAQQFLEGVAYLQRCSVAHLDLKPDNIVVQRDAESMKVDLAIIDFNISVFADAEPTISGLNGTPGWLAPEVSAGKSYNPLLADRWSCGRVLEFFTGCMKPSRLRERMYLLSQRLINPHPSLRPPVLDVYPPKMGKALNPSIRIRESRPAGAPRLGSRNSRRLKGLGLSS